MFEAGERALAERHCTAAGGKNAVGGLAQGVLCGALHTACFARHSPRPLMS